MLRTFSVILGVYVLAGAAAGRETTPFRAGSGQPGAKNTQTPPDNPQQVIENLRADFDRAGRELDKKDPGLAARKAQQRIIDGIDKLLEQEDPSPSKNQNAPSKPENQNAAPPAGTKPAPKPMPQLAPGEKELTNNTAKPKSVNNLAKSQSQKPTAIEDMRQEPGAWPPLPPRHRVNIDAYSRQQFIRNYHEILREYYRALAESDRRKDGD
jgi:hypothetical protein